MNRLWATACVLALSAPAFAQDPVHWSGKVVSGAVRAGGAFDVAITGVVDDEWHVYSITQGPGGPIPTTIVLPPGQPFARHGPMKGPEPTTAFDRNFEIQTETYSGTFAIAVPVAAAAGAPGHSAGLRFDVGYQACTDRVCLPPRTMALSVPVTWARAPSTAETQGQKSEATRQGSAVTSQTPEARTAQPSVPDLSRASADARPAAPLAFGASADSWSGFIWLAVTMGALSLLTPCVFPMVPITVSYFTTHAAATRAGALGSAALYGLGIVLTFTLLGSALAAVAGAAGLNRLAANPWLNLAITALFVLFAMNLFGVYDVRLPGGLLSRLHGASRRRGTTSAAGTLLMALTFTITSLTCTAAFLGTLLVVAAQGEWERPLVGLLAYSATFALPFVVLAVAPQLVSQLPRSGAWLTRVKVVMGFLEIAAAMKFLSNADLVWSWGLFSRSVVLVTWTATAVLLAVYLLARRPGAGRIAAAVATLIVAGWLLTGARGRSMGELEAFLPPSTASAEADPSRSGELPWVTNDLPAALGEARRRKQLVFIDFTGYTCTNCRWMEANMFPRTDIRDALQGFVRARLYTDGRGGVFDRQQRYQQDRFKTVALPLYAIVDADQNPVATFAGLTRDSHEFLRFLRSR